MSTQPQSWMSVSHPPLRAAAPSPGDVTRRRWLRPAGRKPASMKAGGARDDPARPTHPRRRSRPQSAPRRTKSFLEKTLTARETPNFAPPGSAGLSLSIDGEGRVRVAAAHRVQAPGTSNPARATRSGVRIPPNSAPPHPKSFLEKTLTRAKSPNSAPPTTRVGHVAGWRRYAASQRCGTPAQSPARLRAFSTEEGAPMTAVGLGLIGCGGIGSRLSWRLYAAARQGVVADLTGLGVDEYRA